MKSIYSAKSAARRENMIKFVDKYVMRPKRLMEAVQAVIRDNDELLKAIREYEEEGPTNLTWLEGDRWFGWTYNPKLNRYYFDDIGNESLTGLWEDQWLREADSF
jgi:hypothetical protein